MARLSLEDEAHYRALLHTADARTINAFLRDKGFSAKDGIEGFVAQRDKAIKAHRPVNYGASYDFAEQPKASEFDAIANGGTSIMPGRDALVAGLSAASDQLDGSKQTFLQDYEAHRDGLENIETALPHSAASPILQRR